MTQYKVTPLAVSDTEAFSEASREELRALLVIIECNGRLESVEELARLAGISKARASSSLVLWEEAGVISELSETDAPTVTEEFEARLEAGEIEELESGSAARSIRSNNLADMINEFAALLGRATLNTPEIKKLTALSEQYSLSPEYILTLAAYMAQHGKLTVSKLTDKAIKLTERDICDTAALDVYLTELAGESEIEYRFRGIFGIYGRALSKTEKEAFKRWSREYGYFTDVVGEAYDIAVTKASRGYVGYADRILTHWYESGCRTLAECRARYEAEEAEKRAAREAASTKAAAPKSEKKRYGDFDAEEAFKKALERSYGKKD